MGSQDTRDWDDKNEDRTEDRPVSRGESILIWGFVGFCCVAAWAVFAWGLVSCVRQIVP